MSLCGTKSPPVEYYSKQLLAKNLIYITNPTYIHHLVCVCIYMYKYIYIYTYVYLTLLPTKWAILVFSHPAKLETSVTDLFPLSKPLYPINSNSTNFSLINISQICHFLSRLPGPGPQISGLSVGLGSVCLLSYLPNHVLPLPLGFPSSLTR